jgi:hypothetical protein
VSLRFAYLAPLRMFGWIALFRPVRQAKDTEILILRHRIAVLQRHVKGPIGPSRSLCPDGTVQG